MHYYIITGGPLVPSAATIVGEGRVIAADAGIDFCFKFGIKPDLALGDMDSVSAAGLERVKNSGIPVKIYPVEKDFTDTEIAISCVPEGNDITLICPLRGRLDHIIANLQMAGMLHSKGRNIVLDDGVTKVSFLCGNETKRFSLERWGNDSAISLVPLALDRVVSGVTTENLYYPLKDGQIGFGRSLSFSNKPAEGAKDFTVSIREGLLGVVISRLE